MKAPHHLPTRLARTRIAPRLAKALRRLIRELNPLCAKLSADPLGSRCTSASVEARAPFSGNVEKGLVIWT
jgi:hypothetical protein